MLSTNRRPTRRRSSRRSDKQRQQAALGSSKPGLSLDTNFSRHIARPPQQVFPSQLETNVYVKDTKKSKIARLELNGISPGDRLISIGMAVPTSNEHLQVQRTRNGSDESLATPTIVVTPAKEDFDLELSPKSTPSRRIPSSVYSRYTDVVPRSADFEKTPPVPPLPFSLPKQARKIGLGPFVSTSMRKLDIRSAQATSICTVFEEDATPVATAATPSARHSKGWWNFITSPFSAQSTAFTWRSPIEDDRTPILQETRALYLEEEIHSAPTSVHSVSGSLNQPPRSMTAPSILSTEPDGIDIYRIPSQGEAAAYYDLSRHFPSLIVSPSQAPKSVFEDDTPLTNTTMSRTYSQSAPPVPPFPEHLKPTHKDDPYSNDADMSRALFSSPFAEELKTPVPMPPMPDDHYTTTSGSQFSPLSPSPIVGHAHIAHIIQPASVEEKEIKTPSPPTRSGPALGNATMASRSLSTTNSVKTEQVRSFGHSRTSSYGLGITGSEVELFPPPPQLNEKHDISSENTTAKSKRLAWWRRCLWPTLVLITMLLTLMIILLVMHVPQHHSDIAVQAQWLNLTGYPPLPIGISTIAQPKSVRKEDRCIASTVLWSCDAPSNAASNVSAPNFRFEVRFRNESQNSSTATAQQRRRSGGAVLFSRDTWTNSLYDAKPVPPSIADQIFLGNTTDNNTMPFDGEATPFYMSLLDAATLASSLQKRQYPYPTVDDTNTTNNNPQSIPTAVTNSDGTPLAATLYPLAEAQPLRLYKRGQSDEHYGFYTYYDKTIYISNGTNGSIISNTALSSTSAVCTWSQSRLLVQIWTRSFVSALTSNSSSSTAASSSANDMTFPGSFPYATTLTIDRHGGDPTSKSVFCHGVGANGRLEQDVKNWIQENRAYGGSLINAASASGQHSRRDTTASAGIDGGTGGCACAWQNW